MLETHGMSLILRQRILNPKVTHVKHLVVLKLELRGRLIIHSGITLVKLFYFIPCTYKSMPLSHFVPACHSPSLCPQVHSLRLRLLFHVQWEAIGVLRLESDKFRFTFLKVKSGFCVEFGFWICMKVLAMKLTVVKL